MEYDDTFTQETRSESINELAKALAQAQASLPSAKKSTTNPFYKSKYADLSEVQEAVREPLSKAGLSYCQTPFVKGKFVGVRTMLMHTSGQWLSCELSFELPKLDPQSCGSAITYARRYSLAAMIGVSQEDDDGEKAQGRKAVTSPSEVKPKSTKDIVIDLGKSKFKSPDEFSAWRVDNELAESLSKATEKELKAIYEKLSAINE